MSTTQASLQDSIGCDCTTGSDFPCFECYIQGRKSLPNEE